jgi:hypothetical protein
MNATLPYRVRPYTLDVNRGLFFRGVRYEEKVPATKTGQSGIFSRFGGWHHVLSVREQGSRGLNAAALDGTTAATSISTPALRA